MEKYYECTGIVNYCDKDAWVTIDCPDSVVNYYKSVIEWLIGKKLSTPYHGGHLTCLPAKHNGDFRQHIFWKKHHDEKVLVKYSPIIYTDKEFGPNRYFWLKCQCDMIGIIRQEFGLNPSLLWPIHLTCAYLGY
jgi:hypothetical protein